MWIVTSHAARQLPSWLIFDVGQAMKDLKRNRVFELLGAKPTNPRWSWCALATNRRGAIFTIWEDGIRDGRSQLSWEGYEAKARPGATDKRRILEIAVREQIPVYGLICVAVDPSATPRSIKEVKGEYLVRLQIERDGSQVFGRHAGVVPILEAAREIQGSVRTQDDGLQDLDDAPPGNPTPDRAQIKGAIFVRDPKVRAHVLRISDGRCEYCGEEGFVMSNGRRYVEAHHIISLAAEGRDTVDNVIALCPKHHREAHFGHSAEELEVDFVNRIRDRKRPNKAPEPTTLAVTSRAPSSTSRASEGRGSS